MGTSGGTGGRVNFSMSESKPFHPETEKPQTPQEILASLGDKFQIAWDVCLEAIDQRKLDIEKLVKNISKLNPQYLEHAKKLFEDGVTKAFEEKKQLRTDKKIETEKNNLSDLLHLFVERVEFYSRLKPPEKVPTGGRTAEQLEGAMEEANINISNPAHEMMHRTTTIDEYGTFTTTKETKTIDFVRLKVKDLFRDSKSHIFEEILSKAKELGLEPCQSEDGPNYRLHYTNQPEGEWVYIGMKQISDSFGYPHVFGLSRAGGGLWLRDDWSRPTYTWNPWDEFVLRLNKYETK